MKILVLEDDAKTADFIRSGLLEHGHTVDSCASGPEGLWLATENQYDVLIIDRMLAEGDGLEVIRRLRDKSIPTPALILTAMGSIEDRVEGLNAGGDDYLVKPFAFAELYARICSLARRPPLQDSPTVLKVGDLELNLLSRRVSRGGTVIEIQATEFRLLEYLMRRAGQVVTRTMLLEGVWDFNFDPKTSIVETHISRLRAKIELEGKPPLIRTIRGAGYMIDAPANS